MMYIVLSKKVYNRYEHGEPETITWHIGENIDLNEDDVRNVLSVQADCDELEYIELKFKNLPMVNDERVVEWFGDHAKFIARHLSKRVPLEHPKHLHVLDQWRK